MQAPVGAVITDIVLSEDGKTLGNLHQPCKYSKRESDNQNFHINTPPLLRNYIIFFIFDLENLEMTSINYVEFGSKCR
jgi:hypothetical protein